eukprot:jgi/Chrzof1/11104/Cz05g23230.t1
MVRCSILQCCPVAPALQHLSALPQLKELRLYCHGEQLPAGALSSWTTLVQLTFLRFQAKMDVEACAGELGQLTTLRKLTLCVGEAKFAEAPGYRLFWTTALLLMAMRNCCLVLTDCMPV